MLAMDRDMRRACGVGNVCHLLVTLERNSALQALAVRLSQLPLFRYVSSLRLSPSFMRSPRWIENSSSDPKEVIREKDLVSEGDLRAYVISHDIDTNLQAPFGATLLPQFQSGPSILFHWHHALCDAHGGEKLVRLLAEGCQEVLVPSVKPRESLLQALSNARKAKQMIFQKSRGPLARLLNDSNKEPRVSIEKVVFSREETMLFEKLSKELTNGIFPSAILLAASARAATRCCNPSQDALLIPVPHDVRRTTKERSVLSNQASFLFFRFIPGMLESLPQATNEAIAQLQEAIAEGSPRTMLSFLRIIRRLPLSFLWRIIETPTKGHPASLYFSDIGDSLSLMTSFLGGQITYATHYPPLLSPPGLTTVWSRYRGLLELTVCYDQTVFTAGGISRFLEVLKTDLLGETHHTHELAHG